ncbi:hypothetical protein PsorP6_008591 [Peronosclerospora sorghi]|uniref:Uncharacterized protein n=1 Tax=Peronosclerospora sorghi TaxID=230839 RepID=A0ACC0WA57_9STRA|nr:hypothetical protein PsorP6_008591 [Peronosclerospora sorghi]
MSASPGRFDALLTQLAKKTWQRRVALDSFFNFLYRKTDFYVISSDPMKHKMGFLPGEAQEKVLTAFQKHPMKNLDGNKTNSDRIERPLKVPIAIAEVPKLTAEGKQRTDFICVCNAFPLGNGGVAANYSWTQTLEDISIQMVLKNHTQAKDLECRIESTRLSVTLKSGQTKLLLAGEFPGKIRADESIWSLESNYVLHNPLEKTKPTWWACH